jgi:hypothetical protein
VAPTRNTRLEAVIRELGWPQDTLASHFRRVAAENGALELLTVTRSHIAQWLRGAQPRGQAPTILCETLSRGLSRVVTLAEVGLGDGAVPALTMPTWDVDTLTTLVDLGGTDLDMDRRQVLVSTAYSVAGLALPPEAWWTQRLDRARTRRPTTDLTVTDDDVESVREMTVFFSRRDQRRGGRAGRNALVAYLRSEVADYVQGRFTSERTRLQLMAAVGELAYLAGWTAFDASEHSLAQRYFKVALHLAAEADDGPLAGHVLRAMAHQAVDLGRPAEALNLSTASLERKRYTLASPREKSLLVVVHARAEAATGQRAQAAQALIRAEDDLRAADSLTEEPGRVFFFSEASLAHETACALRDLGDLAGAEREFQRSVRTRQAGPFARTHAVTLGYLGDVQVRRGHLDAAVATWTRALDAMGGVHSGRTRDVVVQMRRALSPVRSRGGAAAAELDDRARTLLQRVG